MIENGNTAGKSVKISIENRLSEEKNNVFSRKIYLPTLSGLICNRTCQKYQLILLPITY